ALAKHSSVNERELNIILERNECPPTGDAFVAWSLCVGAQGWVRFPLKLWVILHCLSSEEWATFTQDYRTVLPMIAMFETSDVDSAHLEFFSNWLAVLDKAIQL